ncbi:ATP-binding protein [Streptomyces sp. NPDC000405]|uniref:ATP-binding protein n=1 Tax=Streptomyces sp. NPDC000405 TaxID=3161033 RepID=UPI00398CC078
MDITRNEVSAVVTACGSRRPLPGPGPDASPGIPTDATPGRQARKTTAIRPLTSRPRTAARHQPTSTPRHHPALRKRPRLRAGRLEVMGIAPRDEAISQARHALTGLLTRWGITADVIMRAELIASELLSNALRHAAPRPGGEIGLQVVEEHGAVLVEVEDGGNNSRPALPFTAWAGGRAMDDEAEHGRGLLLVEELGQGWGWRRLATGQHSVWAYVAEDETRGPR